MELAMKTVGTYEAKTHFSQILDSVMHGEKVFITKHGVPVAVMQQPERARTADAASAIAALKEFRKRHSLGGLSVRELLEAGRR
jgi:antitoxin (DNA-binding transcriptional repressor) of toxin-antitoxin stability system